MSTKFGLLESLLLLSGERQLQELPDYTSPPLPIALDATPEAYRSDNVIESIRAAAGAGNCTATDNRCHIPFPAPESSFEGDSKVGVVFYGGGLVDPRGYSVIAHLLATRYGFPTVIPIFDGDIAFTFGTCDSGRLDFAKAEFPTVEKWVLAGHSFGGIAAMSDMWDRWNNGDDSAAGLAMLAADIRQDIGCGDIDYSMVDLPMASVIGSVDGVLNATRWEENKVLLSNATQLTEIYGGNHGLFGAYDDSERFELLGQTDGDALITPEVQWDLIVSSIASVASRTGVSMPVRSEASAATEAPIPSDGEDTVRCINIDENGVPVSSGNRAASAARALAAASLFVAWL